MYRKIIGKQDLRAPVETSTRFLARFSRHRTSKITRYTGPLRKLRVWNLAYSVDFF